MTHSLLLFALASVLLSAPPGSAQPGFISIDCGAASNYTDANGIEWVTDAEYIKTGISATIQIPTSNISLQSQTVRYFSGVRNKNCYVLPGLTPNISYLVRATFLYGNYDNQNYFPTIDLVVNTFLWNEVQITAEDAEITREIYLTSPTDSISVCLARSGTDTPFINSLQLRPLSSNMTIEPFLQGGLVVFPVKRVNYGASSSNLIRYPYDRFDRIWFPDTNNATNTTHAIEVANLGDSPPSEVLETALDFGSAFRLSFSGLLNTYYHVVLYFAEIGNVSRDGQRVFDIYLSAFKNGSSPWFSALDIFRLSKDRRYIANEVYGDVLINDSLVMTFVPLPNSTFTPILSAVEILQFYDPSLKNSTYPGDVEALALVQADFNLTDWSGDPCLPNGYIWNWIICSSTSPPRVTALVLSKQNLQGKISPSINLLTELIRVELDNNRLTGPIPDFSRLSKLETLDLQNNELTGPIPANLTTLTALSQLFVQNNNLSGEIPAGLLQKATSGSLNFKYGSNPGLPCGGSSGGCAEPAPAPASSASVPLAANSTHLATNSTRSTNAARRTRSMSEWGLLAPILLVACLAGR